MVVERMKRLPEGRSDPVVSGFDFFCRPFGTCLDDAKQTEQA